MQGIWSESLFYNSINIHHRGFNVSNSIGVLDSTFEFVLFNLWQWQWSWILDVMRMRISWPRFLYDEQSMSLGSYSQKPTNPTNLTCKINNFIKPRTSLLPHNFNATWITHSFPVFNIRNVKHTLWGTRNLEVLMRCLSNFWNPHVLSIGNCLASSLFSATCWKHWAYQLQRHRLLKSKSINKISKHINYSAIQK